MKAVGLRELKNRLSEYVRSVRAGEGVLVTDRGEIVAELCPPGRKAASQVEIPEGLQDLARRGLLTPGAPNEPGAYPVMTPLGGRNLAARLLDDERGEP